MVKAAAVRPAVTATTGGAANVPVSLAEDALSTIVSLLSVIIPVIVGVFAILSLALLLGWWWRSTSKPDAEVENEEPKPA